MVAGGGGICRVAAAMEGVSSRGGALAGAAESLRAGELCLLRESSILLVFGAQ